MTRTLDEFGSVSATGLILYKDYLHPSVDIRGITYREVPCEVAWVMDLTFGTRHPVVLSEMADTSWLVKAVNSAKKAQRQ